jgi:hypothetical protein
MKVLESRSPATDLCGITGSFVKGEEGITQVAT